MTSLTFHGGINEIGGNKILLRDGDTQIFLDFGKNFAKEKQYYEEPYIQPRKEKHLLNLGILPNIPGIYKDDSKPPADGLYVSHPHLDHWTDCCFLDNDIPILCGEATKSIVVNYCFTSKVGPSKEYSLANFTKSRGKEIFKTFRTFRTGDKVPVGPMELEPIHVDHSIPGSYGLIVHTSSGSIVYTGDLRQHGPRAEMTENFIDVATDAEPELLITEATNIAGTSPSSEEEVRRKQNNLVENCSGLAVVSFNERDIDRLRTIGKVSIDNERKLAISMKQAFMLLTLAKDPRLKIFDVSNPNILIFRKEKERIEAWEEEVLKVKKPYSGGDLNEIQDKIVLIASLYDMNELMDMNPKPSSIFIMSHSEPFDEEGEIRHEKLQNWCEHYGMPQYSVHASGHMMPYQLKSMIRKINPKRVVPVHLERPRLFERFISDLDCKVKLPKLNERVKI